MSRYYDRQGNPAALEDWAAASERADRHVGDTTIGDDVRVSTVFLGLDHNWGVGPPHIFETMVFGGDLDEECVRYSTEAQALAGHDEMVARVREVEA